MVCCGLAIEWRCEWKKNEKGRFLLEVSFWNYFISSSIDLSECHNPYQHHTGIRLIPCAVCTPRNYVSRWMPICLSSSCSCSRLTNNLLWQPSECLCWDSTRAIIYADGYSKAERKAILGPCISFVGPLWFGNCQSNIIILRRLSNDPGTVLLQCVMHQTLSPFLPDLCLGFSEDSIKALLNKCGEQQGIVFIWLLRTDRLLIFDR